MRRYQKSCGGNNATKLPHFGKKFEIDHSNTLVFSARPNSGSGRATSSLPPREFAHWPFVGDGRTPRRLGETGLVGIMLPKQYLHKNSAIDRLQGALSR
jgi:hypothetical protein